MVEKDERLTPSTGTIHRPAIHSTIDPRPSHSKVRDPASTSYLTTGKFHVLKLPFHSPHVSSVGRSMRMWCHTRFHPSFIFCQGRMDEHFKTFISIIHRLSYHSIQVPLRQSSTSHHGTCERRWWRTAGASESFILLDLVSSHDKTMYVDEISQMDEKCIRNHVMMEITVLEMCLFKLTWVFGGECVMQIRFVDVLCIKFLECVMQWHKIRWYSSGSELVSAHNYFIQVVFVVNCSSSCNMWCQDSIAQCRHPLIMCLHSHYLEVVHECFLSHSIILCTTS